MTANITTKEENKPPRLWGVLPWTLEDGTTAESARRVIIAFLEYTHDQRQVCRVLRIGARALAEIERTPLAVSRDVGRRTSILRERMKQFSPSRLSEVWQALEQKGAFAPRADERENEPRELFGSLKTNVFAGLKMGAMVSAALQKTGLTVQDVARELGLKKSQVEAMKERLTPKTKNFFRVCELLDIKPEDAGFVDFYGRCIEEWRETQRAAKKKKRRGSC